MRNDERERLKRGYRKARKDRRDAETGRNPGINAPSGSRSVRMSRVGSGKTAPERKSTGENIVNLKEYSKKSREMARKEARTRNLAGVNILSIVLFALFLGYLGFSVYETMTKEKPSTVQVVYGSVDVPVVHNGIIIRDEELLTSPAEGVVYYKVNDGDKVKHGAAVCEVYDEQAVRSLEQRLTAANDSIMSLQEKREGLSMYESDIKTANTLIKKEVDDTAVKLASYDVKALYVLAERIGQTLSVRNGLLLGEDMGSLVSFTRDREKYESQLKNAITTVQTAESGVVSYKTDGLEDRLLPENRFDVTKEQAGMKVDYDSIYYTKEVKPGDVVCKIIKSNEWYVASYISASVAAQLTEGGSASLYVINGDNYDKLSMTVEKKTEYGNEFLVVFKSTKLMAGYLNARTLEFKINMGVTQGFKIPNTAIAERLLLKIPSKYVFKTLVRDFGYESSCVMKKGAEEDVLTEISIVSSDGDYTYVLQELDYLKLGDKLSMPDGSGEDYEITEFENVNGVYVINSGITEFRKINLGESASSNSDYTILDPKINKSIKIDDTIVSDAKRIID